MSDKERMDRAKRIRQMREGNRDGDDAETDDATATETGEAARSDGSTPDSGVESEEMTREATTTNEGTPGEETRASEAASTDGGATAAPGGSEPTGPDGTGTSDSAGTTGTPDPERAEAENAAPAAEADAVPEEVPAVSGSTASVPSAEEMEAALEGATGAVDATPDEETAPPAGPAGIAGGTATTQDAETRVLEFTLADEQYCLDIEYIEEIVKQEQVTRVPNTPAFVEGVVDLRGQITTILNPKVVIGKDDTTAGDLIVVFDSEAFEDQGHMGWVVDDVRQVSPIADEQVNDPPMQEEYINGVIDRDGDDGFVIWTTPDLVLEAAD
jgi:purine-binding chemotaxis protein CheW